MITPYGPWMTFGGEPITGKPRPSFVVHADPPSLTMSAEQQGFVRNAYAKFCTGIATSCIPNGYHSREYSAADGTRVRVESINGAHRVQAWISGGGELSADPWFYQGYVLHPQSPVGGGRRLFIPFTINKSVTKLKPLSPDFISSDDPPYVYDVEYFHSTVDVVDNTTTQSMRSMLPEGEFTDVSVGGGSATRRFFHNNLQIGSGGETWERSAFYRGEELITRLDRSIQDMFMSWTDSYARTATAYYRSDASWLETSRSWNKRDSGTTVHSRRYDIFNLSGKKIHTIDMAAGDILIVPDPPTPSWFNSWFDTSYVWGRLRKGYYYAMVGPFWPGSIAAHFYEWGANEIRAQTTVARDAAGRIRPVIFCPHEARGAPFPFLWRTIVSSPNTWGAIAAYDQVLHGWRGNSTDAHTLALTGTSPAPTHHTTTTEALLQGAGIDPALASRVTISDLNMVSTDQSEEPLFPTWLPSP